MAQVYSIDGVALTNRVRTTASPSGVEGLPSSAWYGEAMIAGVTIEDPLGELDLMGWHTFTHDETSCVGSERTFTGWITGKDISRGTDREKQGAARIWECEIIDQNAVWKLKLFRASSAKRPAETDNARMAFMLASAPMAATPVADNGRWNVTDNPVSFGESDYVAQYPIDLANSISGVSGKNFYAYWDDAAGEISGHYDLVGANPLSTITISNVIADRSDTCVYPFVDAVLTRSPEDQVNGVLYNYRGGYVYVQDPDLFGPGEFSPDNFDRDVLYATDRVGRLETANAQAAAQLSARSAEHDTLTVTILLPPSQVNLLHAGMRVASRFTHLPGYEAEGGVDLAVIRRNVVPPPVRGGDYTVRLELSNMAAPTSPGGGDPGGFPPVDPCESADVSLVQGVYDNPTNPATGTYEGTWDTQPIAGHLLIASWLAPINGTPTTHTMDGWVFQGQAHVVATGGQAKYVGLFTKIATSSEPMDPTAVFTGTGFGSAGFHLQLQEWAGVDTVDAVVEEEDEDGGQALVFATITPTSGVPFALLVSSLGISGVASTGTWAPLDGPTMDDSQHPSANNTYEIVHLLVEDPSGSYEIGGNAASGRKGAVIGLSLTCSGGDPSAVCIDSGQPSPVDEAVVETPDGTIMTFTTRCPFADETLHVKVDNLNQDAAVTSYDGAAGTFTLGYAPVTGEQVTVNYLGR